MHISFFLQHTINSQSCRWLHDCKHCIFWPLLWGLCISSAAPRPLERFTLCNSAYKSHIRWYFGRNKLLAAQLSTDLLSANSVYCCHPVWPPNSNWVLCAFSPPLSIAAKWTRIDLWLSPAATQQKSSTSTRRKAESPRTRMLMWLYGTQGWPGEKSSSGHSAVWEKSLEIEQWQKAFS